jgi:hypothetical protein
MVVTLRLQRQENATQVSLRLAIHLSSRQERFTAMRSVSLFMVVQVVREAERLAAGEVEERS